jgi:hypothetical protein
MADQIDTYADLLRQIRNDLRLQHPEWIEPNGQSPMCDFYEARLIQLLSIGGPNDHTAAISDVSRFLAAENSMAAIVS